MANQFLSLALFLMLLAFFVVLNGMSDFEDSKSRPVMNSIALAFSNDSIDDSRALFDEPAHIASIGKGDTLEDLSGLFGTHIAGFEVSRNRMGSVMHVRTSIGEFENAIDIDDTNYNNDVDLNSQGAFMAAMISLLRSKESGLPYRMDMIVNIPEDPAVFQKQNPDEFIRDLRQVSKFAQILENAGMPRKMLSAGLAKGDVGIIDLYFYQYKPLSMPVNVIEGPE